MTCLAIVTIMITTGLVKDPSVVPIVKGQTFVGVLTLNAGENNLHSSVIDIANGFAYFGTRTSPGGVVKVRLSDFTRVGALALNPGEDSPDSSVIDPVNGFAYFGLSTGPGIVVKVRLSDFTRVGALNIGGLACCLESAAIDTLAGFAYFGGREFASLTGVVLKIRLSNFTLAGALTLNPGENEPRSAVIDIQNGFAYFGTRLMSPSSVVKIMLSDFTRVGALTLNPGEDELFSAAIDIAHGFAYFGTDTNPGSVVKVKLSDFTRVGALTLNTGENQVRSAVIDTVNGLAYFGLGSGSIVTVGLSDLTRRGSLSPIAASFESAVIDVAHGLVYFGTFTSPGTVVKLNISEVAHWRLDEGSGTTTSDSSGSDNTGTLVNGPTWVTGVRATVADHALSFNGVNQTVRVASSDSLNLTRALTLGAWFKPATDITLSDSFFYHVIIKFHGNPADPQWRTGYFMAVENGRLYLGLGFGGGQWGQWTGSPFGNGYCAGQWYHFVATYDSSLPADNIKLYVNSVLQNSVLNETRPLAKNTLPLFVPTDPAEPGWHPQVKFFNGTIDDARVYNQALTATDIGSMYGGGGSNRTPPNCVASSVGGTVVSIDRLAPLAPYIGFASLIGVATVLAVVNLERIKKQKAKRRLESS